MHGRRHSACVHVRLPVADRHRQGCLKRFQATMVGGKLFVKSFPPHPPSETSRLFRPCRLLPVCVPVCVSAQAGPHRQAGRAAKSLWNLGETLSSDLSAAQLGTPPKRLRPSREGGWQARRFPPVKTTTSWLEPRSSIAPWPGLRCAFRLIPAAQ